jgi:hypothetical protein
MRREAMVFLFIAAFFIVVDGVYWFTSHAYSGSVMLLLTIALGLLPGTYLLWWSRHMEPRPEDQDDATPANSAGVVGAFPGSSIWPFVFGMGAAMIGVALVFGPWTAVPGVVLVLTASAGYVAESRRGGTI